MLSKTLFIAAAALGLTAGAALADGYNYPDKVMTPAEMQPNPENLRTDIPYPEVKLTNQAGTAGEALNTPLPAASSAVNASATVYDLPSGATLTVEHITNGPVPDTPRNRAAYGGPDSHAGRATAAAGN